MQQKEMMSVWGDGNGDYTDLTVTHCLHVSNYKTLHHKYVQYWCKID